MFSPGICVSHEKCRRNDLENVEDVLFVTRFFPNGILEWQFDGLCRLTSYERKKILEICIKSNLLEEKKGYIYMNERGIECNDVWHRIQRYMKSMVSSVFIIPRRRLKKEIREKLEKASSFDKIPRYPLCGDERRSSMMVYIDFLMLSSENKGISYSEINDRLIKDMSFDQFKRVRKTALKRGYVRKEIAKGERRKIEYYYRTKKGTVVVNTLNWFTSEYELIDTVTTAIKPLISLDYRP